MLPLYGTEALRTCRIFASIPRSQMPHQLAHILLDVLPLLFTAVRTDQAVPISPDCGSTNLDFVALAPEIASSFLNTLSHLVYMLTNM